MAFQDLKEKVTPENPSPNNRPPSPAQGTSLTQDAAIPPPRQSLRAWQAANNIDRSAQIKLTKISHMRYQHPDLSTITTFLHDFGLTIAAKTPEKIWFKGYGPDQYVYYAQSGPKKFLGGAFEVASYSDLEKAASLPGATPIQELTDAPGRGYMVTLTDPEGFPINLLHGQTPKPAGPMPEILTVNYEVNKPRAGRFQRFKPGPAPVHKLGHYGLCVKDFSSLCDWYARTFNLVPTDFLYVHVPVSDASASGEKDDGVGSVDVAAFLHVDLSDAYTDHHSFFMSSLKPSLGDGAVAHVHHCSFEVHDFDVQNLGHEWLKKRGYESVWGVGRHVLGSQVFDYWWDTSGNMVEHYADGDLVNEETPVGWGKAGDESLAVWGPDVPESFLD